MLGEDADRASQAIAWSVLQCIAERGLEALTVSELAVRLDQSRSGLYRRFSTRVSLLRFAHEQVLRGLASGAPHLLAQGLWVLAVSAAGLGAGEERAVRELAWRLLAVDDSALDDGHREPELDLSAALSLGALLPAYGIQNSVTVTPEPAAPRSSWLGWNCPQ